LALSSGDLVHHGGATAFSTVSTFATFRSLAFRSVERSLFAARRNPRVARVVGINPYDYANGRGVARTPFGWLVTYAALLPVVGETVMRLRNSLMSVVLRGGVADADGIPPAMKEMYLVGNRLGQ
jgi:hypothetical protein